MTMSNGPIEPSADLRAAARGYYHVFVALTQEGFTEPQALEILGNIIRAQISDGD